MMSGSNLSSTSPTRHRLFILFQHGSHGHYKQFKYLQTVLRQEIKHVTAAAKKNNKSLDVEMKLWGTEVNEEKHTDQGTVICAQRLVEQLLPAVEEWIQEDHAEQQEATKNKKQKGEGGGRGEEKIDPPDPETKYYFSVVGHSFGGLILREAIHHLFTGSSAAPSASSQTTPGNIFHRAGIRPVTFITCASPHCGVSDIGAAYGGGWKGMMVKFGAKMVGRVYSQSYKDLFLMSDVLTEKQLASAAYLASWNRFHRKHLYGNTHGDKKVSFHTSTCLTFSPSSKSSVPGVGVGGERVGLTYPHVLPAQDTGLLQRNALGFKYQLAAEKDLAEALGYPKEVVAVASSLNGLPRAKRTGKEIPPPPAQLQLSSKILGSLNNLVVHPVVYHVGSAPKDAKIHSSIIGQHALGQSLETQHKKQKEHQHREGGEAERAGTTPSPPPLQQQEEVVATAGGNDAPGEPTTAESHDDDNAEESDVAPSLEGTIGMPDVALHLAHQLLNDWKECYSATIG